MKHDETTGKLLVNLERYIGSKCYNPRSYNGWTGETGCHFSYPVHFNKDGASCSWFDYALSMHYKFGANHLYVGRSLLDLLECLEERYGLDLSSLEAEYQAKEEVKRKAEELNRIEREADDAFEDQIYDVFIEKGYVFYTSDRQTLIFTPDLYDDVDKHRESIMLFCTRRPEEVTSDWLKTLMQSMPKSYPDLHRPINFWAITTAAVSQETTAFAKANNIHLVTNPAVEFAPIWDVNNEDNDE